MRRLPAIFACLGLLLAALPRARAHATHRSLAEADWRPDSGRLEVALRVFADDFEAALSRRADRDIALERTSAKEFDALSLAYLRATFTVRPAGARLGAFAPLAWVGRELKDDELWLYFQFELPAGLDGARLAHAVLRDLFPEQLNTIRLTRHPAAPAAKSPPPKLTLTFLRDEEQVVRFPGQ